MAQPLIALLKRFEPDGRIDALAGEAVAPVFAAMAEIADVLDDPQADGRMRLPGRIATARRLARRRYDRVFVLPTARRIAFAPWFAGIPHRVGLLGGRSRWGLINDPRPLDDADRPVVERFAQLAFAATQPLPAIPHPVLRRHRERELALRERLCIPVSSPLIVLCPGADAPTRRWPTRHFAALAAMLVHEWPDASIALAGDLRDRAIATEIAALSGQRLRNLCGELALADLLALLSQAAGVVSNDGDCMHFAAAYGRPQVAVFGATDPRAAPPRSSRAQVAWLRLECAPCFDVTCRLQHLDCVNQIAPRQVFDSLRQAMQFAARA